MSNRYASRIEPYGHEESTSKLERVWCCRPAGQSIARRRTTTYDDLGGVFYSPMEYFFEPISQETLSPATDEKIAEEFTAFVKGEFGTVTSNLAFCKLPAIVNEVSESSEFIEAYLSSCERDLVYSDYVRGISNAHGNNFAKSIESILSHPSIGHKSNGKNVDWHTLTRFLLGEVKNEQRLMFVLPSFPFKDQNYFRTHAARPDEPDLGELALLVRLHSLSIAFYQVHPFGADWVIASDGMLYSDIFGVTPEVSEHYFRRIKDWRTRLNLHGTVSVLDLKEMISHVASAYDDDRYSRDAAHIGNVIGNMSVNGSKQFREAHSVLVRGMRQNLSNRNLITQFGDERAWRIVTAEVKDDFCSDELSARSELEARATIAANRYATENLLLRRYNIINQVWPTALRATVHPKPGQIAVPQLGSCFPWNGVAFVADPKHISPESVTVSRFHELARDYPSLVAHRSIDSGAVMYYSPAK